MFICVLRRYFYNSLTTTPQNGLIVLCALPNIKYGIYWLTPLPSSTI